MPTNQPPPWAVFYNTSEIVHTWPRCLFQSIPADPLDQVVFSLFGGHAHRIAYRDCTQWNDPEHTQHHSADERGCECSAPLPLRSSKRTFVEIGANNGVHMSNTWFFERYLGWRGICVEANPHLFTELQANRPNCTNVNSIISNASRGTQVPFIAFSWPKRAAWARSRDWETGMSGIEGSAAKPVIHSLASAQQFAKQRGLRVERVMLPVRRFDEIFREQNIRVVDFFSIDVEGSEEEVLRTIDFDAVCIRVLALETVTPQTFALLRSHGFYELGVKFVYGDRIFLHPACPLRRISRISREARLELAPARGLRASGATAGISSNLFKHLLSPLIAQG